MKNRYLYILIILILLLSIGGCPNDEKNSEIDAKIYFDISVPNNSEVFFQLPIYKISSIDFNTDNQLNKEYVVGTDIKLNGTNVEQLNGANVILAQYKLKDMIVEGYYESLLLEEDYVYNSGRYKMVDEEFVFPTEDEIEQATKILKPYMNDFNILICTLVFNGKITEDVVVNSLEVMGIDFDFTLDTFKIHALDLPENQTGQLYDTIEFTSFGGMFAGPSLSPIGTYFIEGTASQKISKIEVSSVSEGCTIIDSSNYQNFSKYEEKFDTTLFLGEQKLTDFEEGDKIYIEYTYVFDSLEPEELKTYDVIVASILSQYNLEDGTVISNYEYQPSIRTPEHGMIHILHELIND